MQWAKTHKGFTIVELLVVVVVIGILAAIVTVAYNGIQQQARVSVAKSDLAAISKQVEVYQLDNFIYPTSAGADNSTWEALLTAAAGDVSDSNKKSFVVCRYLDGSRYAIVAWKPVNPSAGGDMYYIGSDVQSVSEKVYPGQGGYSTVANAACATALNETGGFGAVWSFQL